MLDHCTFEIKIKPRAGNDRIESDLDGKYKVSVTSPAIDNKANEHCIILLAKKLSCPKSALKIIKGGHSRNKVIACEGLTKEEAHRRLHEHIP